MSPVVWVGQTVLANVFCEVETAHHQRKSTPSVSAQSEEYGLSMQQNMRSVKWNLKARGGPCPLV